MSSLGLVIATGSFTIAAGVLGVAGTGFFQWRARKRDERDARDRMAAEVVAAADDLRQRVELFQGTWALGSSKGTAVGIEVARAAHALIPEDMNLTIAKRIAATALALSSAIAADGIIGKLVDTAGGMYLQAVTPAVQRLTTATAPLRISPDAGLAAAASDLAEAAITYASEAKSGGSKFKRADKAFEDSLSRFLRSAVRPRKR